MLGIRFRTGILSRSLPGVDPRQVYALNGGKVIVHATDLPRPICGQRQRVAGSRRAAWTGGADERGLKRQGVAGMDLRYLPSAPL
jgi:hypothetical protein